MKLSKGEYVERGETVKDPSDDAIASGTVVTSKEFDALFPNFSDEPEEGANQPSGTPSNMGEVEGTKLAAPADKDEKVDTAPGDTPPSDGENK
jgi:hypothetical protein